jgi:hypothetical protein
VSAVWPCSHSKPLAMLSGPAPIPNLLRVSSSVVVAVTIAKDLVYRWNSILACHRLCRSRKYFTVSTKLIVVKVVVEIVNYRYGHIYCKNSFKCRSRKRTSTFTLSSLSILDGRNLAQTGILCCPPAHRPRASSLEFGRACNLCCVNIERGNNVGVRFLRPL